MACAVASTVSCLRKSSGRRVIMSTAPATPPSTRSAVALLCTTALARISDGISA